MLATYVPILPRSGYQRIITLGLRSTNVVKSTISRMVVGLRDSLHIWWPTPRSAVPYLQSSARFVDRSEMMPFVPQRRVILIYIRKWASNSLTWPRVQQNPECDDCQPSTNSLQHTPVALRFAERRQTKCDLLAGRFSFDLASIRPGLTFIV